MPNHTEIINKFYSSFQRLDAAGMVECYDPEVVFFDPAFGLLIGIQARSMWAMLCRNAKDFHLTYGDIQELDEEYATCSWTATYTFSRTGRKVVNSIKANFRFRNGKIIEHSDAFSLHKWSAQALGFTGWLLGWNSVFQQRIRNQANRNLLAFMQTQAV